MIDKELKKEQKLKQKEERKKLYIEHKEALKKEKKELHLWIKGKKLEIKNLKIDYKKSLSNLKKSDQVDKEEWESLKIQFFENRLVIKDDIIQKKFDFGAKFKTTNWLCLKWSYGIKKEFNRIVWSNTTNTFKYLGIILLVIGILALLFFGIDNLVGLFQ